MARKVRFGIFMRVPWGQQLAPFEMGMQRSSTSGPLEGTLCRYERTLNVPKQREPITNHKLYLFAHALACSQPQQSPQRCPSISWPNPPVGISPSQPEYCFPYFLLGCLLFFCLVTVERSSCSSDSSPPNTNPLPPGHEHVHRLDRPNLPTEATKKRKKHGFRVT